VHLHVYIHAHVYCPFILFFLRCHCFTQAVQVQRMSVAVPVGAQIVVQARLDPETATLDMRMAVSGGQ